MFICMMTRWSNNRNTSVDIRIYNILNQIKEEAKNWNMPMFEIWYGAFDVWLQNLQDRETNTSKFLDTISTNKQNGKLQKLKRFEFTL